VTGADPVGFVDSRLGAAPLLRKALRYVFPDHWTFMIGEIALYAFVVLVGTGVFLALYFDPSTNETVYRGSYAPLQGATLSQAYSSTVGLSYDVPAGLLMRQAHHWAALVFVAAILVHLMRVFFTGAFRRPRDVNWFVGLTMLVLAIVEGFAGYSLPDDLLSGIGLVIAYSVVMSLPVVGANAAFLIWGGQFPGAHAFISRLFIVHVLFLPVLLAALITIHLAIIVRHKHSQFAGPGRTESNVVGSPMWPGYALRSLGLLFAVAAVLFLVGGLIQINPIWEYGPYEPGLGTNGAQPDWYLGWLIGALRLMPPLEVHPFGYTLIPNPFFGGILFPSVVFALLYAWPVLERRVTGDRARHDLLEQPRDNPTRTGLGAAFFTWVATIFVAGSADRILVSIGFPYEGQVWFFRIAALAGPIIVFLAVRRVCRDLARTGAHPVRGFTGVVVRRSPTRGFVTPAATEEAGLGERSRAP
jgi:ubiquinol-cytochrome c reductase cytochrome b subunit